MASPVLAEPEAPIADQVLERFAETADEIQRTLDRGGATGGKLDELRAKIEIQRQALTLIEAETEDLIAPLQTQLAPLIPAEGDETKDPTVAAERERLQSEIDTLVARQRRAKTALATATTLSDRLNDARRDLFTETLLTRGESPVLPDRIRNMWASDSFSMRIIGREVTSRQETSAMTGVGDRIALPFLLAIVSLVLAFVVRRGLIKTLVRSLGDEPSDGRRAAVGAGVTVARLLVPALALGLLLAGIGSTGLIGPVGQKLLGAVTQATLIVIGAYALSAAYFAPGAPKVRISTLDSACASRAHRWLIVLAGVVAFDAIMIEGGNAINLSVDALSVLNAGLLLLGGVALWRFVRSVDLGVPTVAAKADAPDPEEDAPEPVVSLLDRAWRVSALLARVIGVAAPFLALVGYFGASRFIFYSPVLSGGLLGVCVLIHGVVSFGTASAAARSAVDRDAGSSPFGIVPVFAGFVLFGLALPLLAIIWGADGTDLLAIWARVHEGFVVGDIVIAPLDFLLFVLVFMIGYFITRSVQSLLRKSVLPLTRRDTGAQSALAAGRGYVGLTSSALIAISTAGIDLSNLAIVAGALSVGIGFGLQNIVNNFVSGIILLIERPIKSGDWVEISGVHGTVQQVNVRSTEIQTFDRSTMFVPNADLISGTVTNWTHGNAMGRLIVGVGAAYGSDARKVEKILLEIARAHPMLMRRPEPYVLFSGFGADSIDFEIRGVLRDVNWILNVGSDIRHSVYERFAEEGVEIPFAQRDVYIKNLDALKS
ncbi:MAG: DUF3772 domain-containing protein [Paracoccaceae bacterium]